MANDNQNPTIQGSIFRKAIEDRYDALDRNLVALAIGPEDGSSYEMLASGVLVRRDGRTGIVTAAHVARPIKEVLDNPAGRVAWMVGSTKKPSQKTLDGAVFPIRLKLRSSRLRIEGGKERGARIADIAWIPLSTEIAEQLEAETIHGFYEWNEHTLVSPGKYHLFVLGCMGVQSRRLLEKLNEKAIIPEFRQVQCVDFPKCDERNGWDFVTVTVNKAAQHDTEERIRPPATPESVWEILEKHPTDYSGMSGGPLWWMRENEAGEVDNGVSNPCLWGIVFLQWGSDAERGVELNCHGPESIERVTSLKETVFATTGTR